MRAISVILLLLFGGCAPEPSVPGEPPVHSSPIVLFVGPDSTRLEGLRARDEEAFYVAADDEMWYRSEGYALLDSLGLRHQAVERAPMRFRVRGEPREYAWRDVESAWFVVVYDGEREPRVTASVDLREQLR
jgi:hypothetical protein